MELSVAAETWALRTPFRIAYEVMADVEVIVVTLRQGGFTGRGEAAGVSYHGEDTANMTAQIEGVRAAIEAGASRHDLYALLPPGGARNAVDSALWDLEARRSGTPAWRLAGQPAPAPVRTFFTLSLDAPDQMARSAAEATALGRDRLKLKLDGQGDIERVRAVRQAAPEARLIVDANQSWTIGLLETQAPALLALGVEMVEQPLPADDDAALAGRAFPLPLCADESCQDGADLDRLRDRYQAVCIKLDKCGGLTEALAMADRAEALGYQLMVGNMCGTSLAMAPALLLAARCQVVDLDGPLLNRADRPRGLRYAGSKLHPAEPGFWG